MPRGVYDRKKSPALRRKERSPSLPAVDDYLGPWAANAAARGVAEANPMQAPVVAAASVPNAGTDAGDQPVAMPTAISPSEACPKCGEPMQCYGNLEGKVVPMNPPMEDATWACHDCKVRRKVRRPVDLREDWSQVRFYELLA